MPVIFSSCQNEARLLSRIPKAYTPQTLKPWLRQADRAQKWAEVMAILEAEGGSPLQQLDHPIHWQLLVGVTVRKPAPVLREGPPGLLLPLCAHGPGSAKSQRLVFHGRTSTMCSAI